MKKLYLHLSASQNIQAKGVQVVCIRIMFINILLNTSNNKKTPRKKRKQRGGVYFLFI